MSKKEIFEENVVSFIYQLGRDFLPLGDIETLVRDSSTDLTVSYSNEPLEKYSRFIVNRLKEPDFNKEIIKNPHFKKKRKIKE